MSWAEAKFPVTMVAVVSCRTDVLPWYEKRGYETFGHIPLVESSKTQKENVTRAGLSSVLKQRINRVEMDNIRIERIHKEDAAQVIQKFGLCDSVDKNYNMKIRCMGESEGIQDD